MPPDAPEARLLTAWMSAYDTWRPEVDVEFVELVLRGNAAVDDFCRAAAGAGERATTDAEWLSRAVRAGDAAFDELRMYDDGGPADTGADEYLRRLAAVHRQLQTLFTYRTADIAPNPKAEDLRSADAGYYQKDGSRQIVINARLLTADRFLDAVATLIHETAHDVHYLHRKNRLWIRPGTETWVRALARGIKKYKGPLHPKYKTQTVELDAFGTEALAALRFALRAGDTDAHYPYVRRRSRPETM